MLIPPMAFSLPFLQWVPGFRQTGRFPSTSSLEVTAPFSKPGLNASGLKPTGKVDINWPHKNERNGSDTNHPRQNALEWVS